MEDQERVRQPNFIRDIVEEDRRNGKNGGRVATRFPPEPNGYLHVGHAKSICLNFGLAGEYQGTCNLRFDDTNPAKEEQEYVDSIIEDVKWLGGKWPGEVLYASDYFENMYAFAEELIRKGKAFVCDLTAEDTNKYRGTLTAAGKDSPFRSRTSEENLDLFRRMRAGEFNDGSRTLRAKIDMSSPNVNLRDPVMYRIVKKPHHRQGDKWCIYPMYDWAHGFEDSLEGITHSICTLEFEDHRPLYDWFINAVNDGRTEDGSGPWGKRIHHPQQIEFARLHLTYTVLSKRKLIELVQKNNVSGWSDPRMPTISGMRRRGYPSEAIRDFCDRIGVAKANSTVDYALLENCVRELLNKRAPRVMAVIRPLKVVITNYPEGKSEEVEAVNNPEDLSQGTRLLPFGRELYIEQDDFREVPPKGYYRLSPGKEIRLKYAYFITCETVIKNDQGEVIEVHCRYDPASRGGNSPDGRKVKGTSHWVSAQHAIKAEVRLYDHLFRVPDPDKFPEGGDYKDNLNPNSLEVLKECYLEPTAGKASSGFQCQFERLGYFIVDPDSQPGQPVFTRTSSLRDTWAKLEKTGKPG
jgi:glutaminyl-tRNA synthetase